jgi:hypothetical protein
MTTPLLTPEVGDILIRKLDEITYVLSVDGRPCGQYHQWDRVFGEALRLAGERSVNIWIRADGYDTLIQRAHLLQTTS